MDRQINSLINKRTDDQSQIHGTLSRTWMSKSKRLIKSIILKRLWGDVNWRENLFESICLFFLFLIWMNLFLPYNHHGDCLHRRVSKAISSNHLNNLNNRAKAETRACLCSHHISNHHKNQIEISNSHRM